jgi:CTP synthase (UTP-ammonia lyase)
VRSADCKVAIAAIGDRDTRYLTHREIDAALALFPDNVNAQWIGTDTRDAVMLADADGIWLLPGTPYRDDKAAYAAIRHTLTHSVPFLGTCGGFQYACIELARTRAGIRNAVHAETDPTAQERVIVPLKCALYGEERTVTPIPQTLFAEVCGSKPFAGYHYCGFGVASEYLPDLQLAGVVVSATAPDAGVEAIEVTDHLFFVATAFQPQVGASTGGPLHPLITAFIAAAASHAGTRSFRQTGSPATREMKSS